MMVLSTRELQRFFDRVRSNKVFEMFVVSVILFSAVMIGVNSYALDARVASAMENLDPVSYTHLTLPTTTSE